MNVTIQEHGQTSTGKPKVKANGTWYFLSRDIGAPPAVGATVEIREGSFNFPDGKPAKTIEAWRPVGNGAPTSAPSAPPAPNADYIDEASLRFISNVVGSAITAGAIKSPGQVLSWFQSAKAALIGKPAANSFDDDIPAEWDRQQHQ